MNTKQKVILIIACLSLVLVLLFPPYYGLKLPREENLHTNLGMYPAWSPPSLEIAREKLIERYPNAAQLQKPFEPELYHVDLNKVRLILHCSSVMMISLLGLFLARTRTKSG